MSIEVKQKIKDVADDFAMPAKKLIEIVGKFYEKPKKQLPEFDGRPAERDF